MNRCPVCGSTDIEFLGMQDGGGGYGSAVCEEFECLDCGYIFEGRCYETELFDDLDDEAEVME